MQRSPSTSKRPIREVWEEYQSTKSDSLRNTLMEIYLPLVRYNAERIHVKLPSEVELDDLMSAGVFGLIDAIKGFDLGRNIKFETYCAPRIRGAILDEIRNMDWVPRLVRSRTGKLEKATGLLRSMLGRDPTKAELQKFLKMNDEEMEKTMKDGSPTATVSLSRKWFETDSNKDVREIDVLEDKQAPKVWDNLIRTDLRDLILKGLSRAEKMIVILYYQEAMTMKEIGATLDLSESRVSQMHSSIIARLRGSLADKKYLFMPGLRPPKLLN